VDIVLSHFIFGTYIVGRDESYCISFFKSLDNLSHTDYSSNYNLLCKPCMIYVLVCPVLEPAPSYFYLLLIFIAWLLLFFGVLC